MFFGSRDDFPKPSEPTTWLVRFAPVTARPVRTVSAYRARQAAERRAAIHDQLRREVEARKESAR